MTESSDGPIEFVSKAQRHAQRLNGEVVKLLEKALESATTEGYDGLMLIFEKNDRFTVSYVLKHSDAPTWIGRLEIAQQELAQEHLKNMGPTDV